MGIASPQEAKLELARRQILPFTEHTFAPAGAYNVGWHHRKLCRYLDDLLDGPIRRLMVFMPPQHGKSELVSRRLPAYALGRFPDRKIIACSYTADLATDMCRDTQSIIDTDEYAELFPDTKLSKKGRGAEAVRKDDEFAIVGHKGRYVSAGVDGSITGKGFWLGIIDDPFKNYKEANSKLIRDNVENWYNSTFLTRQAPDSRILLTMTRWHPDDLAGRLLRKAQESPKADQWTVLRLPAIAAAPLDPEDDRQIGQCIWPEWYGESFYSTVQASIPAYLWSAMYQQSPTKEGGNHFKREWFHSRWRDGGDWYLLPGRRYQKCECPVFITCDPAGSEKESADYTVFAAWAITPGGDLLLLNIFRQRIAIERIAPELALFARRHGASWVAIELTPKQAGIISHARWLPGMPPVKPLEHGGRDKLVRATPAIVHAQAGKIFLPEDEVAHPWVKAYVDELVNFTGHEGDEDDQVDVTAYAAWQIARHDEPHDISQPETQSSNAEERGLWGRGGGAGRDGRGEARAVPSQAERLQLLAALKQRIADGEWPG